MKKIVHMTSVHNRYDTRIFLKQCITLSDSGYNVYLVVADGLGDEIKSGVKILDVGCRHSGRLDRIFKTTKKVYIKALELNADLYQFHDPELMPIGLKLKRKTNSIVIFDSHEDVPKQLLSKHYLNKVSRVVLSKSFQAYQTWSCKKISAVITSTPSIRQGFEKHNILTMDVRNYPILKEFNNTHVDWSIKSCRICYIGGLERNRGIYEILDSALLVNNDFILSFAGSFSDTHFESEVKEHFYWQSVDDRGWLSRDGVSSLLNDSSAGLVTLQPAVNFIDSLPIKMFEYMAAGLPVIASNFVLWKEIIENEKCGLCIDPLNPKEIAQAIDYLIENPKIAEHMGNNGRKAVLDKYNWTIEAEKLLQFYALLLGKFNEKK